MRCAGVLVVSLCVGILATGCAGDAGQAPVITPESTPTPTPVPTPTPSPTVRRPPTPVPTYKTPSGPVRVAKGQTRPGARLRFGQRAIVPIRRGGQDGVIGIVVGKIRRTAGRNVTGNFDGRSRQVLNRSTAYYAPVTVTNLGGTDLAIIADLPIDGRRRGGGEPDVALIGGELDACPGGPSPDSFNRKGAVWRTCMLAVARDVTIREAHYREPPYGREIQLYGESAPKYNQYYSLGDIVWH